MFKRVVSFFRSLWGGIKALFGGNEMTPEEKSVVASTTVVVCGTAGAIAAIALVPGSFIGTVETIVALGELTTIFGLMFGGLVLVVISGYLLGNIIGRYLVNETLCLA